MTGFGIWDLVLRQAQDLGFGIWDLVLRQAQDDRIGVWDLVLRQAQDDRIWNFNSIGNLYSQSTYGIIDPPLLFEFF